MEKDYIRLNIFYVHSGVSSEVKIVASDSAYKQVIVDWADVSCMFVSVKGRINDVDANEVECTILREDIVSVEKITVNGL